MYENTFHCLNKQLYQCKKFMTKNIYYFQQKTTTTKQNQKKDKQRKPKFKHKANFWVYIQS